MSTSNVDSTGMKAGRNGALNADGSLQGYAGQNNQFATSARNQLFGQGGSLSGMMNPNSMNVSSPQGAYATEYTNQANQINQGAQQGQASAQRQAAERGMGRQPAGTQEALSMTGYQNAANQRAQAYGQDALVSQQQATNNFWNATNAYNQSGNQAAQLAGNEQEGAAGNYANIYSTGAKQKNSIWNTLGSMGGFNMGNGGGN